MTLSSSSSSSLQIYHLYTILLNGGPAVKALVTTAFHLPPGGPGLRLFEFEFESGGGGGGEETAEGFVTRFCGALDNLVDLETIEEEDLIGVLKESIRSFRMGNDVIRSFRVGQKVLLRWLICVVVVIVLLVMAIVVPRHIMATMKWSGHHSFRDRQ